MKHRHIEFHDGHITWTGKEAPSKEVMEAFEDLWNFVNEHEQELNSLSKSKQDKPLEWVKPNFKR
jgi:hypothetical protein